MRAHDEGDTIMTNHKIVLPRVRRPSPHNGAFFTNRDDDEASRIESYRMDFDTFQEMGEPAEITVTIEPGDMLNADL
jgi:hypothetical protein